MTSIWPEPMRGGHPRDTLIAAALVGPFGAYGAMHLFRHKTKKKRFYLVPFFMIIHIAGMLYVAAILLHIPL